MILSLICVAALILPFASCGGSGGASALKLEGSYTRELEGTVLNVSNWGEYISDGTDGSMNVVAEFQKLTGITVNYTTFDSNELLYAKLAGGGSNYDVIIPSDYLISRLISEGLLHKIHLENLSNYKYVMEEYTKLYYDPSGEYSVPYTIGMVGLIYNKTMVTPAPDSWAALWDEAYKDNILMIDNPRDAFGVTQFLLGQSVNSTDPADWQAAAAKLKEQAPLLQTYVTDDVYNLMEDNAAALAPYYAGDYVLMNENNEDLGFVYPKEGTNFFYDSMCIPTTAQNIPAAELFINFMLEPAIALANAETVLYAVPNASVRENPDYSYKDNPYLYPAILPQVQCFENLPPETLKLMSDLWTEVKQS
jgi:spermidine/putrescine transport system substrate-binding protein